MRPPHYDYVMVAKYKSSSTVGKATWKVSFHRLEKSWRRTELRPEHRSLYTSFAHTYDRFSFIIDYYVE